MNEQSVIQTTAEAHGKLGAEIIAADLALRKLTGNMTEQELVWFGSAAFLFWNHATAAILRHGNCKFEREESNG